MTDTIYALATSPGVSGVAIIRVSGPESSVVAEKLTGRKVPEARFAVFRKFIHPDSCEDIDAGLFLWFEGPESFTGEDVCEFHIHGGHAVIEEMLEAIGTLPVARHAEAGEFSKRAFLNGKMDLTQVEAVADIIEAKTRIQLKQARSQFQGILSRKYELWTDKVISALAMEEALLDFSDEDDVSVPDGAALEMVSSLIADMEATLSDEHRGELIRDGIPIVLFGKPNAGKSSLMNVLTGRDVAIVSPRAGTTRDVVETRLDIAGYPVFLFDTAGLRETSDDIEAQGVHRAKARIKESVLALHVIDGSDEGQELETRDLDLDTPILRVRTRRDCVSADTIVLHNDAIWVSTITGEGLDQVIDWLAGSLKTYFSRNATAPITRQRHRESLCSTLCALKPYLTQSEPELRAESLRQAMNALQRLTGRGDMEDVLNKVFSSFCIGK